MGWWGEMTAQFVGGVLAGAILVPVAVWLEARLDEQLRVRQNRHEAHARKTKPHD